MDPFQRPGPWHGRGSAKELRLCPSVQDRGLLQAQGLVPYQMDLGISMLEGGAIQTALLAHLLAQVFFSINRSKLEGEC